ncbi:hypothetical protein [Sporosarcina highlanderae]|uniref:Uncharacterized protein n=1 Tax=Sporosarcina highlanderae TaxID=3035916 RepID=A0ABT8JW76_9BACL|nr:hypothetical protein [Sporosarcina highlanderae]MDN4609112.1 hypothetical protein [Sporosarcina highlanderae]
MYGFLLNMWIMRKIDEEKVESYVPKILTRHEADMILATPQGDEYDIKSVPSTQL